MVLPGLAPGPSSAVTSSRIHQASEGRHCPGGIRPRVCRELAEGLWARPGILKGTWVGWGGARLCLGDSPCMDADGDIFGPQKANLDPWVPHVQG